MGSSAMGSSAMGSSADQRRLALPGRLLLVFLVFLVVCGLLAMHGLQASSSPRDDYATPVIAVHHMNDPVGTAGHDPAPTGREPHDHDHRHPGGPICLALVAMTFVLLLLLATVLRRHRTIIAMAWAGVLGRVQRVGRSPPPPGIYQLAVLRL